MRIVGGRFKGRALAAPKSQNIRPTTDRTRESLFNIISHSWPEKLDNTRILDVFAGSGALGLEALSRGGEFALFLEISAEGRALIRSNVETLNLTGNTKIFRRDAKSPGSVGNIQPFDLVFADPPYGKGFGEAALSALLQGGWLKQDALVVLEEEKQSLPHDITGFQSIEQRRFGDSAIGFFRPLTNL